MKRFIDSIRNIYAILIISIIIIALLIVGIVLGAVLPFAVILVTGNYWWALLLILTIPLSGYILYQAIK